MAVKHRKAASLALSAAMLVSLIQGIPSIPMDAEAADYKWSTILKNNDSWFGSSEGTALADTILQYQLSDGGWRKAMDDTSQTGSWGKSTIDNDATTSQIRVLAKAYSQTGTEKYLTGCLDGIDLLIDGQYDNGGWPQVFNDAGTYHAHITYNDNAMIHVIELLTEVRDKSGDFTFVNDTYSAEADNAVDMGIQCILDTQIMVNGVYTGWCQQHDEKTLKPASGRAYELESISASESVNLVNYLKTIDNPSNEILRRINAAVTWMTNAQLNGIEIVNYTNSDGEADKKVVSNPDADPIWARFYYLTDGTTPMFVSRESVAADNWDHIGAERRTGYSWYGTWPKNLVKEGTVTIEPTVLNGNYVKELTIQDEIYGGSWSISSDIQTGGIIYGDRDFTYITLPDELIGAEYIRTSCDSKFTTGTLGVFKAGADISVYVAIDSRVTSLPSWLSGWENTGLTCTSSNTVTYTVYKKDFASGETVTLGENGQSSGCVGYTVFADIQQEEPTTEPPTPEPTEPPTPEPAEPTTDEPTEPDTGNIVWGDANLSGDVEIADSIAIMAYVTNSEKYPLEQQGKLNADVYQNGDGVAVTDAVSIQKYLTKLIKALPES
ncbi:MAG: pectate lyase [Ruminococcus sp.]|nr:pectate lyase [Ruminococcus sp.]